jgi:hypothetical protein
MVFAKISKNWQKFVKQSIGKKYHPYIDQCIVRRPVAYYQIKIKLLHSIKEMTR